MIEANTYPVFQPNQVLTHTHLNAIREYLDGQSRLSRCKLIGTGIVCGFDVSMDADNNVTLSKGCGITSEGYLACQDETVKYSFYNPKKPYKDPSGYEPFSKLKSDVFELLTVTEKDAALLKSVPTFFNTRVAVAFIEYKDEKIESCISDNCDEHGTWRNFTLRILAVEKSDAIILLQNSDIVLANESTVEKLTAVLNKKYTIKPLAIERICGVSLKADKDMNLEDISSYYTIGLRYCKTMLDVIELFTKACNSVYACFSPVLSATVTQNEVANAIKIINDIKTYLENIIKGKELLPLTIQYHYDFFRDLVDAYNEFITTAFDLISQCCPNTNAFPRHLLLGEFKPVVACEPTVFRQFFKQPPIYNGNSERLKKTIHQFIRLLTMINNSGFFKELEKASKNKEKAVIITPSRNSEELISERSIPYYYNADKTVGSIENYWSFEKSKRCQANFNLSYNSVNYSEEKCVKEPLSYSIEQYPFLRIEGQIGKDAEDALKNITELRKKYELPFDVTVVHTGDKSVFPDKEIQGYEDLQVTYSIWRNKILLFLNNLVWLTHTLEKQFLQSKEKSTAFTEANKKMFYALSGNVIKSRVTGMNTTPEFQKSGTDFSAPTEKYAFMSDSSDAKDLADSIRLYNYVLESKTGERASASDTAAMNDSLNMRESTGYQSSEDKFVVDTLVEINKNIRALIALLVLDLKALNLGNLLSVYKKSVGLTITIMKFYTDRINKNGFKESDYLWLQLFSWIHKLLSTIAIKPYIDIRILIDNYLQRKNKASATENLFDFIKKHKGIEHNGGVEKGGTFILVCETERAAHKKSENPDVDKQILEFQKNYKGRIVADFRLPYIINTIPEQRPVVAIPLIPLVLPKCMVIRPFDNKENDILRFPENELQILNAVYDPKEFTPEINGKSKYGKVSLERRVYEPDLEKYKMVMVYQPDADRIKKALSQDSSRTILLDEFEYQIVRVSDKSKISASTITVFIHTEQKKTTISGAVYYLNEKGTKIYISGAKITDNKTLTAYADANGAYTLNASAGEYSLTASAQSYENATQRITVGTETKTVDFELKPVAQNVIIKGVVSYTDSTTGKIVNIAGATVTNKKELAVTTNKQGQYQLNVAKGNYSLTAIADTYVDKTLSVKAFENINTLNFSMQKSILDIDHPRYTEILREMRLEPGTEESIRVISQYQKRIDVYLVEIEKIKKDPRVEPESPIYSTAESVKYIVESPEVNIVEMNNIYTKSRNELYESIQRSTGNDRELQVKAYKTLTMAYLDRLAIVQPAAFSKTTASTIAQTKDQTRKVTELDMRQEIDSWSDSVNEFLPNTFISNVRKTMTR